MGVWQLLLLKPRGNCLVHHQQLVENSISQLAVGIRVDAYLVDQRLHRLKMQIRDSLPQSGVSPSVLRFKILFFARCLAVSQVLKIVGARGSHNVLLYG